LHYSQFMANGQTPQWDAKRFRERLLGFCQTMAWGEASDSARELYFWADPAVVESAIQDVFDELTQARDIRVAVDGDEGVDHRFWHRWYTGPIPGRNRRWTVLRDNLVRKGWSEESLENLDEYSTKIVSRLPPPASLSGTCGRGNVMGYVQSGKTTSFMAVIAKAIDAGYDGVIVLSGMTNNLRDQTFSAIDNALEVSTRPDLWVSITEITPTSDRIVKQAPWVLAGQREFIGVFKKNVNRLRALKKWLETAAAGRDGAGAIDFTRKSILIIDDEADQAGINTVRTASEFDLERIPTCDQPDAIARTAINQAIVDLFAILPKEAYVGYSATPFANLLSDPNDFSGIYPRDFVLALPKGEGYFGPSELFGRDPLDENDFGADGLDIIRGIPDADRDDVKIIGAGGLDLPKSFRDSVYWFLIATATRRKREGSSDFWSSMLVNLSAMTKNHFGARDVISGFIDDLRENRGSMFWGEIEQLAKVELAKSKVWDVARSYEFVETPELIESVSSVLDDLRIIVDNFKSEDRLNYEDQDPFPVIVVGGNTLSRGLVLQGLISTYFLRTSTGYDVLLQMGRWFGYRRGYEDLQRIWMRKEMEQTFRFLALVEEEIRQQIEMLANESTPLETGILIRTHPKLRVSGRINNHRVAEIGYSGSRVDTTLFPRTDAQWLDGNISAVTRFLEKASESAEIKLANQTPVLRGVSKSEILELLQGYKFADDARIADGKSIAAYIENVSEKLGELEDWDVFVFNYRRAHRNEQKLRFTENISASKITRAMLQPAEETAIADIKTLSSQADWQYGIDPTLLSEYLAEHPSEARTQTFWHDARRKDPALTDRGMLGIFVVDKDSVNENPKQDRFALESVQDFVGLTFFFPKSRDPRNGVVRVGPPEFVRILEEEEEFEISDEDARDFGELDNQEPDELKGDYFGTGEGDAR
jgi:hypothetical protein